MYYAICNSKEVLERKENKTTVRNSARIIIFSDPEFKVNFKSVCIKVNF